MKLRVLCFLIVGLLCGPANAQIELANTDQMQTRFGTVAVVGEVGAQQLLLNGQIVPDLENWSLTIVGSFALADEPFDYVLVSDHGGGNACEPPLRLLRISAEGALVGPTVGGCVYPQVLDVRLASGQIEIDTPHRDFAVERSTFIWDGISVTEWEVAAGTAAPSRADPRQWVGQHPYRIFEDPAERARFEEIMRDWQIEELATRIGPANSTIERNGWVLGAGCMAHNCGTRRGVWGIRIVDGEPAAATMDEGLGPQTFGIAASDPVFQVWIEEHRP